jgi:hypothetical protein
MQLRLNGLSCPTTLDFNLTGISCRRPNRIQDNRTFLSGIESYGAEGNETLTGVNFAEPSQKMGARRRRLQARKQRGKKKRGNGTSGYEGG